MKKQTAIAAFLSILLRTGAYAADMDASKYLTLDESSIKIEALDENSDRGPVIAPPGPVIAPPGPVIAPKPTSGNASAADADAGDIAGAGNIDVGEIIDNLGNIVNLADQIWTIIDKNKAVVNINVTYANAVPFGTTHWTQLQGWSKPATKRYSFSANSMAGTKALDIVYQVHWTYGGNFQGKGKFLTGVTIEPLSVSVPWSYKVDLKAEVPNSTIVNVGTSEDPIAGMQVQLQWTVSPVIGSAKTQKVIYYVQGDGLINEIGTPFLKGIEEKSDRKAEELNHKYESVKF